MKRIVVTGNGKSGSWKIRGDQLGHAIGALVDPHPGAFAHGDTVVFVKRIDPRTLAAARRARTCVVWDVVDSWPQPHGNLWPEHECMAWLTQVIAAMRPDAIVAATHAMAHDIQRAGFKGPVLALPHHARPGQDRNPIRPVVTTVGYEGGVAYLGKWWEILKTECAVRGWQFVVNPPTLADLDIVVALREVDGYAPRHWKSNVKLANAQGSGTPIICNRECGYFETGIGGVWWADGKHELRSMLGVLADHEERLRMSLALRTDTIALESVALKYRAWLESL